MTVARTYFTLGANFIVASLAYRGRRPAPEGATSPSATHGARLAAAPVRSTVCVGLEPGRPGTPNALRVSSTLFQEAAAGGHQKPAGSSPAVLRPWASFIVSSLARRSQASLKERPAVSHRWRSDRMAARRGSRARFRALELFYSRFSRSPPFEPFPLREPEQWKSTSGCQDEIYSAARPKITLSPKLRVHATKSCVR